MGNPGLSLIALFVVGVFSVAVLGLQEYNYIFLPSCNLAVAARRNRVVCSQGLTCGRL